MCVSIAESFLSGEAAPLSEAPHSRGDPGGVLGAPQLCVSAPPSLGPGRGGG